MTNEEFIKNISFKGEEWRDVVGFENVYMISSFGRVASLERYVPMNDTEKLIHKNILSCTMTNSGYFQAKLWSNNKQTYVYVHRMVAEAFIPNPNKYSCVDHIDTNRLNNTPENLRWCTHSMNSMNPITNERMKKSLKGNKKIIEFHEKPVVGVNMKNSSDVRFYRSQYSTKLDGFNSSKVSAVCRGERNHHRMFKWYFLSDYEALINKSKNDICQSSD